MSCGFSSKADLALIMIFTVVRFILISNDLFARRADELKEHLIARSRIPMQAKMIFCARALNAGPWSTMEIVLVDVLVERTVIV